jgi:hypothetical protein
MLPRRLAALLLWLPLALAACDAAGARYGSGEPALEAVSYRIGGERRYFNRPRGQGETSQPIDAQALAEQAGAELGCAAADVHVRQLGDGPMFVAEGCGKRAPYLRVGVGGVTRQAPGAPGITTYVEARGFVSLAQDDATGVLVALAASLPPGDTRQGTVYGYGGDDIPHQASAVQEWIALDAWGAHDLGCPRADVTVEVRTTGRYTKVPIAEGCGHRATYLYKTDGRGFDLAAIVPVDRP